MTTLTIPITAYSIQASRPRHPFRQAARMPVKKQAGAILLRAPLTKIPAGATVSSARIRFRGRSDESGSRTGKLQPVTQRWDSNVTWNGRPNTGGTIVSVTKSSPQFRDLWEWTVTAAVAQVVSGQRVDRGWQLWTDDDVWFTLAGSKAAAGQPELVVEFSTLPAAPDNLHPSSGTVGTSHPVLTFDAVDSILSLQVQLSSTMTDVVFDSGTVAAAGGYLDLADTAYTGLSPGMSRFWRVRQRTAGGWSDFSDWVEMTRAEKPALTLLSPTGTDVEDGTPVYQWSYAGTQTAYQARLFNAAGDVIADSGYTPGTDTDWTPARGFTRDGQEGSFELKVWGEDEAVATAGDPEYSRLVVEQRLVLSDTVAPVSSLAAYQAAPGTPEVLLTGTRAEGIPDEVDVFRDEVKIARHAGADVFTGTSFTIPDVFVSPGLPVSYRVAPRVNGETAAGGAVAEIAPYAHGVWLFDAESPAARVVIASEIPEQTQPEQSIVHTPLSGDDDEGQVVRRRLTRFRPQGSVTGVLDDLMPGAGGPGHPTARECEALLREWAKRDAGHLYLLVFSGFCRHVIIGDIVFTELDNIRQQDSREVGVKFSWWGQQGPA